QGEYHLPLVSAPDQGTAEKVFDLVWRFDFTMPGFCLLDIDPGVASHTLRFWMVDLKERLSESVRDCRPLAAPAHSFLRRRGRDLLCQIPPGPPGLSLMKFFCRSESGPSLRPGSDDPASAVPSQAVGDDRFLIPGQGVGIALVVFNSPNSDTGSVALAPPPVDVADVNPSAVVVAEELIPKSGRTLVRSFVKVRVRCRHLQPVLLVVAGVVVFNRLEQFRRHGRRREQKRRCRWWSV